MPELLDRDENVGSLGALADELGPGSQQRLVLVAGALMALHGLRQSTRDVDSVRRLQSELVDAAQRVAVSRGL